jgi:hypothetical protein
MYSAGQSLRRVLRNLNRTGTYNKVQRFRILANPQRELPSMWTHHRSFAADYHYLVTALSSNEWTSPVQPQIQ